MIRKATHSGSWYEGNSSKLSDQIDEWFNQVNHKHGPARAIIVPHAGYRYSGDIAAISFKQIDPNITKRIFIFGPLHHVHLNGCGLSMCTFYETPFCQLPIDQKVYDELQKSNLFLKIDVRNDEKEHSLEMQLPFIAYVMQQKEFTIVPILVGSTTESQDQAYGEIFAKYLNDNENCFVISSDFCHWGRRFHYTFQFDDKAMEIFESIRKLDLMALDMITNIDYRSFIEYLKDFRNTICGRHPIRILLQTIIAFSKKYERIDYRPYNHKFKFLEYKQSNEVRKINDSSVSYASVSLTIE